MNSSWIFQVDAINDWAYCHEAFSKEECKKIISYGTAFQKGKIIEGESRKLALQTNARDSGIYWVYPSEDTEWLFRRLTDVVTNLNKTYFGFDLFGITEPLQLTKYEAPSGFYNKHIDRTYGTSIRKLSVTIQLSDPSDYEGGDLLLHFSDKPNVMEKSIGKLIAFPSYTLHEVTPVTKGTRYSLVAWITGNQFK